MKLIFTLFVLTFSLSYSQVKWAYGSYTGTGASTSLSGIGFKPDAVLIKSHTNQQAVITTRDMPAGKVKPMGSNSAFLDNIITSLDSDGFSIGSHATVNTNGVTYQWMAFEDNGDIDIGTYVGKGGSSNVTVNTGFRPEMIWYWGEGGVIRDAATIYMKTNSELCDIIKNGSRSANMIGGFTATTFSLGTNTTWGRNRNNVDYYYIAFNESTNFKDGGFNGTTTDGRSITVGWEPELVVTNAYVNLLRPAFRIASMTGDQTLTFSTNSVFSNGIQAFETNGFEVGTQDLAHDANNANDWAALRNGTEIVVTPLPILLINFDAYLSDKNQVKLSWSTAAEINNDFFSVERSIDGVNFKVIETIQGAGNSNQTIDYTTTDENPPNGNVYYRIRQTDFDKKNKSFNVETVHIHKNEKIDWVSFKENNLTKIKIFGALEGIYKLKIIDLNGNIIHELESTVSEDQNGKEHIIKLPKLIQHRMFILQLNNRKAISNKKIIITD